MKSISIKFDYNPEAFYSGLVVPIALYVKSVNGDELFKWKGSINFMGDPNFPVIRTKPGFNPNNRLTRTEWLALQPSNYIQDLVLPLIRVLKNEPDDLVVYSTDLDRTMFDLILTYDPSRT